MKNKRVISLLIGIFLLLSIPVTIFLVLQSQELRKKAAPATVISVQPSAVSKQLNDTFSVAVAINTGDNTVSAAELIITFDSSILEAHSLSAGDFLTVVLVPGAVTATTATITLGSPPATPKKGSGTLATVSFKAKGVAGSTQIGFGSGTRVAGIGEQGDVLVGKTPGTVVIAEESAPSATPTPIPTPTPTPPTSPPDPDDTPTPTPTPLSDDSADDDTLPPPTATPTRATQEATTASLRLLKPPDGSVVKTNKPTFQGTAALGSTVTIVIFSEPVTGVVTADASGRWSFTPSDPLADGVHTVQLSEQRTDGTTRTITAKITVQTKPVPVSGVVETTLWIISLGVGVLLLGIAGM